MINRIKWRAYSLLFVLFFY